MLTVNSLASSCRVVKHANMVMNCHNRRHVWKKEIVDPIWICKRVLNQKFSKRMKSLSHPRSLCWTSVYGWFQIHGEWLCYYCIRRNRGGLYFPDNDKRWYNRNSVRFVNKRFVRFELLAQSDHFSEDISVTRTAPSEIVLKLNIMYFEKI